ncbi:sugar phosphate isomerase/epimerase [Dactylosporangium vinaceum]|uniref:Sugar phosphate isomerase/epimerase family protein n=1 Tax=Dactylosporangium vinaceum TaxID=53362 RepID=A0ABV5MMW9_9ACTN|nr:sugar phosphate isomerase/epimerase family protein [Dactylosporangium vinaceum]UAB98620.1 sugar phosphate isomerase/epimerase [Dactylosporangium vinaceum]
MSGLRFGYGTNGFSNHRLDDALAVIADLGYEGVALTLDHHHLDPFDANISRHVRTTAHRLDSLGLAVVIETGARYLLDKWHKHAPTLLDDEPGPRLEFLRRAVHIGTDLGAEAVSFWAGVPPRDRPRDEAWRRLVGGCAEVLGAAEGADMPLGFEPEPGMLVESIADWERLRADLGAPVHFGLTLDIGHCRCLEPLPADECVRKAAGSIVNVQIDDMRRGVHEHLEFGTGEVDFPPVLRALSEIGYGGLVAVELPRHSHAAPQIARRSLAFLREMEAR